MTKGSYNVLYRCVRCHNNAYAAHSEDGLGSSWKKISSMACSEVILLFGSIIRNFNSYTSIEKQALHTHVLYVHVHVTMCIKCGVCILQRPLVLLHWYTCTHVHMYMCVTAKCISRQYFRVYGGWGVEDEAWCLLVWRHWCLTWYHAYPCTVVDYS